MKYKLGSHVTHAWGKDVDVAVVMKSIQTELIDKVLGEGKYNIGKKIY